MYIYVYIYNNKNMCTDHFQIVKLLFYAWVYIYDNVTTGIYKTASINVGIIVSIG